MSEPSLIALVERAYRLGEPERAWLADLARAAATAFRGPLGAFAYTYRVDDAHTVRPGAAESATQLDVESLLERMVAGADPRVVRHFYAGGPVAGTLADVRASGAPAPLLARARELFGASGFRDLFVVGGRTSDGHHVRLNVPLRRARGSAGGAALARGGAIGAHLSAALRLRRLGELAPVDATLSPEGTCVHAEGLARSVETQDVLRRAVRVRERARGAPGRRDPDRALEIWRGVIAGRWTLLDRYDRDGRRYVIARRNTEGVTDPRALEPREREVVARLAEGASTKAIAIELGVPIATVGDAIGRACVKLGVANRTELVGLVRAFGAPGRLRSEE
ncbi:MAG: LuxR C-terminal-related transcriptional regulator [Sandaracinaceae bacterium]